MLNVLISTKLLKFLLHRTFRNETRFTSNNDSSESKYIYIFLNITDITYPDIIIQEYMTNL